MKELVILDMDGVIIKGQSQLFFLNYLFIKGIVGTFFYLRIIFWFALYRLRLAKKPKRIMEYAFSFLKGKEVRELEKIIDEFSRDSISKFIFSEIIDIINQHKEENRELLILSNSPNIFVKRVADILGVKNYIGTQLEIKNEKFTGRIFGEIAYGKNKVDFAKNFVKKNNLNLENSYAYADHISDLDLLKMTSNPYAVNPDKSLIKEAKNRNWPILIFKK